MTSSLTVQDPALTTVFQAYKAPENGSSQTNFATQASDWCGRSATALKNGCTEMLNEIANFVQIIFRGLNALSKDTNALAAFFRKLDKHVIIVLEHLSNLP
jgi:hypothetical protein